MGTINIIAGTAPDDGDRGNPREDPGLHPRAAYSDKPKGPLEYTLVHKHPSWLFPVAKDKRTRTGSDWQAYFELFTADVKAHGILQPVIAVREVEAARIVDGQTRVNAALLAGLDSIPILVYEYELTASQLVIAQLTANAQRRDFTEQELAGIYAELMKLNGWSQATLATNIHVCPARVSKILAIHRNLCEAAQAMVAAGKLSPRAAYAISRIPDAQQQVELAEQVVQDVYSVEGIEHHIGKLLGKKVKQPKPWTLKLGGVTATIKGNLAEGAEALIGKLQELVKRLKRGDGPDPVAGLVK